jgi:carbamoyl-phosphate synthase large subunit
MMATRGTRISLEAAGIHGVEHAHKLQEGSPNARDLILDRKIDLIINTPKSSGSHLDDAYIRALATTAGIPCITKISAVQAAVDGIKALRRRAGRVLPLQEYFPQKN